MLQPVLGEGVNNMHFRGVYHQSSSAFAEIDRAIFHYPVHEKEECRAFLE